MDANFWNNIYQTKSANEVSWYQEFPKTSLETILSLDLSQGAKIIDIGGGQSKLAECLLEKSFKDITVLDISEVALLKLKESLNEKYPENSIKMITSNILEMHFSEQFDLWHDRAVFHFLTSSDNQEKYINLLFNSLNPNGYFLISTFSKNGPKKCSGLEICQYDKEDFIHKFSKFELIDHGQEEHHTPFNTIQNFSYCLFKKRL